jgi:hypothetical protein
MSTGVQPSSARPDLAVDESDMEQEDDRLASLRHTPRRMDKGCCRLERASMGTSDPRVSGLRS